jgi:C-terminal processing protease CtpA/Prc
MSRPGSLMLAALLAACGGGGGDSPAPPAAGVPPPASASPATPPDAPPAPAPAPPQDGACSAAGQRESLRAYMEDQYYWAAQAGNAQAATIDGYFQSLLSKPADRYSYSEPTAAHDQTFLFGRRLGYGYTLAWADTAQAVMKVRQVEPQGPAAAAGLKRGDTILSIDGQPPARIAAGALPAVTGKGIPREFRIRDAAGGERVLTVLSDEFALSAVTATRTLDVTRGGEPVKVGYLAYQQFVTYGFIDLGDAVRTLSAAGVKELVLDLRYNGGGSVNVARDLASMVGGTRTAGQVFADLRFNGRHPEKNLSIRYATVPQALPAPPIEGLQRVVVIASGATASASELLVNGLRPFMPVVLIGETTFGKPYGFAPRDACGTTFNAVNFEAFNSRGVGGFTAGFAPDCQVPDDLARQPGDPQEARTRAALFYIANGRCESAAPQSAVLMPPPAAQAFGETVAPRMFVEQ